MLIGLLLVAGSVILGCSNTTKVTTAERNENELRTEYAKLLEVPEEQLGSTALYAFVDRWRGTPYRYGGQTREEGVDCSGFVNALYREVYGINLSRETGDIFREARRVRKRKKLEEGDLVFFDIKGKKRSHVGVYLQNGRFIHASTSKGVLISRLSNPYYTRYYCCGGRVS